MIRGLKIKGKCLICGTANVFIYNTEIKNANIIQSFENLLDIYTPQKSLPSNYPVSELYFLKDDLCDRWKIFNISKERVYELIKNLCKERYLENTEIFDTAVGIAELNQEDYLTKNSFLQKYEQKSFVESIKFEGRFHTEYLDKDIFLYFFNNSLKLSNLQKVIY